MTFLVGPECPPWPGCLLSCTGQLTIQPITPVPTQVLLKGQGNTFLSNPLALKLPVGGRGKTGGGGVPEESWFHTGWPGQGPEQPH